MDRCYSPLVETNHAHSKDLVAVEWILHFSGELVALPMLLHSSLCVDQFVYAGILLPYQYAKGWRTSHNIASIFIEARPFIRIVDDHEHSSTHIELSQRRDDLFLFSPYRPLSFGSIASADRPPQFPSEQPVAPRFGQSTSTGEGKPLLLPR